jgi:hypothetical protein
MRMLVATKICRPWPKRFIGSAWGSVAVSLELKESELHKELMMGSVDPKRARACRGVHLKYYELHNLIFKKRVDHFSLE